MFPLLRLRQATWGLALLLAASAAPTLHAQSAPEGPRCATPPLTDAQRQQTYEAVQAWSAQHGPTEQGGDVVTIPVAWHVIYSGTQGNLTQQKIDDQIQVLNDAFLPMGFQFVLGMVDRTENSTWFFSTSASDFQMKLALAVDPAHFLNLYSARIGGGLLGYAYYPSSFPEGDYRHGVVIHDQSVPGGTFFPYNLGDTATHEVGHYVGLAHTFEQGCVGGDTPPGCQTNGDQVCDTAAEANPAFGCPVGRDTCPTDGPDPIENFMDYVDDACMFEFTPGQTARALALMNTYRPSIMSNTAAFAFPDELAFGDVTVGEAVTDTVVVANLSGDPLEITSVTTDNSAFTANVTALTVAPRATADVAVTFTPSTAAPTTGTLSLVTTDPDVGTITIALSGNGLAAAPSGTVSVPAIVAAAAVGGTDTETLTIANDGPGVLTYDFVSLPSWITSITPDPGIVMPGASEDVTITLSAVGLTAGAYQDLLGLNTNDPVLGQLGIHVVFAVGGAFPPPALVSPLYDDPEVPNDYALTWLPVSGATAYDVQVATDNAFTNIVETTQVTGTTVAFTADSGTTLYWRVRAVGSTTSEWSLPFVFTITSIVANEPEAPRERAALGAAYPNPARSDVTVPFTLDEPRAVTLRIYDVTGRLVGALAEGETFPVGAHTLHWTPEATLPAGVYLLHFLAGNDAATARVVVTR